MDELDLEKLKRAIANAETSGRENVRHPTMHSGLHEGDRAVGKYALMPETINEMANRYPGEFDELQNQSSDDIERQLKAEKTTPELLKRYPEGTDSHITDRILEHILKNQGSDIKRTAASYTAGHNLSQEGAEDRIEESPTVGKYAKQVSDYYNTPDSLLPQVSPEVDKFKALRSLLNIGKK